MSLPREMSLPRFVVLISADRESATMRCGEWKRGPIPVSDLRSWLAFYRRLTAARHQLVAQEAARILRIHIDDMPPATDDVALLLDAIAFRIGATTRADAWRSIGINPNRGRDLLARNAQAVDWPIWFTLRTAALQD